MPQGKGTYGTKVGRPKKKGLKGKMAKVNSRTGRVTVGKVTAKKIGKKLTTKKTTAKKTPKKGMKAKTPKTMVYRSY